MSKVYVYVAGPINGSGTQNRNIRKALDAGESLRQAGYVPFIPHLNVAWDTVYDHVTEQEWMEWDFAWLAKCDALVRLPGHSPGSDREIEYANGRGIAVYYGVEDFLRSWPNKSQEH